MVNNPPKGLLELALKLLGSKSLIKPQDNHNLNDNVHARNAILSPLLPIVIRQSGSLLSHLSDKRGPCWPNWEEDLGSSELWFFRDIGAISPLSLVF